MNSRILVHRAAEHVEELYRAYPTDALLYHDYNHTERVVSRAEEISMALGLPESERHALAVAAWFHDTGHLNGDLAGHEERSIRFLSDFLHGQGFGDDEFVKRVESCIMATKFPHAPENLLEEVMCDADTYHFGTREFKDTNKRVREELRLRGHEELTREWPQRTLRILERQKFFTPYCQTQLAEGKALNVEKWRRKAAEWEADQSTKIKAPEPALPVAEPAAQDGFSTAEEAARKKKRKKDNVPLTEEERLAQEEKAEKKRRDSLTARGVQTALRLASENHMKLSDMADGKANILISVNSIIIGVILSVLLRRLEVDTHLTIPTMIFLGSSVVTIVISILATLPKLSQGRFSREDIVEKRTNLLFFGNFHHSSLPDYQWAMNRLLQDNDYMYGSIVRDIYYLGVVLGRKYRLIRLAYYVFMIGIIASVIAFTLAVMLNTQEGTRVISPATPPL